MSYIQYTVELDWSNGGAGYSTHVLHLPPPLSAACAHRSHLIPHSGQLHLTHTYTDNNYRQFSIEPPPPSSSPQSYELHNAGESAVSYEVDTAPLLALTQSSYLMPILQCLCPQGDVPPRGSAALSLVFSPLEAKRYSVSLCSSANQLFLGLFFFFFLPALLSCACGSLLHV